MMDFEATALEFAERAHGDQQYGNKPYSTHLAAVRLVLDDYRVNAEDLRRRLASRRP